MAGATMVSGTDVVGLRGVAFGGLDWSADAEPGPGSAGEPSEPWSSDGAAGLGAEHAAELAGSSRRGRLAGVDGDVRDLVKARRSPIPIVLRRMVAPGAS